MRPIALARTTMAMATTVLVLLLSGGPLAAFPLEDDKAAKPSSKQGSNDKKEDQDEVADEYLAIRGGDIYIGRDAFLYGATLLAKNGRIEAIHKSVDIPEGAEIIDATGMKVYPGLVAIESRGFLGGGNPADSTDVFSLPMVFALASGITTAVSGSTVGKLTFGSLDGIMVKSRPFKTMSFSFRSAVDRHKLRQSLDKARQYMRDVAAYELAKQEGRAEEEKPASKGQPKKSGAKAEEEKPKKEGFGPRRRKVAKPSDKGIDKSLVDLLSGKTTALLRAGSASELRQISRFVSDYGFKAVIQGAHEGWIVAGDMGRARLSAIITPRQRVEPVHMGTGLSGSSIENARILWEHGVDVAVLPPGTGISTGGIAGRDYMTYSMDAAYAVRGGMPAWAAIEAITLAPARMLGVEDRVGSLEIGKDADVIICDGDLLDYRTFVQYSIVNGRLVYDKQDESLFSHIRPRAALEAMKPVDVTPEELEEQAREAEAEGEAGEGDKTEGDDESGGEGTLFHR